MRITYKLYNIVRNSPESILKIVFYKLNRKHLLNWLPDKLFLKLQYKAYFNKRLNLVNPKTFNEKLQWLKLYDRKSEYAQLVDKYQVRQYIKDKIGQEYLVPLLGVWDSFDKIDFNDLPNQFVLKCTHDSGSVVICKDKNSFNKDLARIKIVKGLISNLFWYGREWPYKSVRPRVIAEKLLIDRNVDDNSISDYKFYCFNGVPKYCQLISDRQTVEKIDFFDMEWNNLNITRYYGKEKPIASAGNKTEKPKGFNLMKRLAEVLSFGFPFIRVDFYNIEGKVYFGELTFYPASGLGQFEPEEWDEIMGNQLELPKSNS